MSELTLEMKNTATVRALAPECTLLLKKDGNFPLEQPCDLALFGNGARNTIRGGTGSGNVYSKTVVGIEDGLKKNGFRITSTAWLDAYDKTKEEARAAWQRAQLKDIGNMISNFLGAVMPEPDYNLSLNYPGDAAVYVLSRISGEGSDRLPEKGDVLLTDTELRDIRALNEKYEKFMLVLNVGGPVDLSGLTDIKNILVFSQLGAQSGDILADILLGRSVPGGKLATTWSAWKDYCAVGSFGDKDDTYYKEGIYVGYRYFDSTGRKALFPFGYGLTYTDFSMGKSAVSVKGTVVTVTVTGNVKNTGKFPGKEVVQVYVSAPAGKLDQPYQSLAAFVKTKELAPGKSCRPKVSFDLADLASYDTDTSSWILEAGDYVVRVGTSSADTTVAAVLQLPETVTVRTCRNTLGYCGFDDWKAKGVKADVPADAPRLAVDPAAFPCVKTDYNPDYDIDPFVASLSDEDLCHTGIGQFSKNPLSIVGNASAKVAGAAGDFSAHNEAKGFPSPVCADGPAGLRISMKYYKDEKGIHPVGNDMLQIIEGMVPKKLMNLIKKLVDKEPPAGADIREQICAMIPIGTALAQSFNPELAEQCGDVVGSEMEAYDVDFWLAPALNIHRSILCGRNFEYYSEDPLVAGKIAAAITRGVQAHEGRYVTLKHYAANNQETNRYKNNSHVSERAMREIYLRGFGIAVREGNPGAVMTSYNLLNGTHTEEHRGLIEDVLRSEFGFSGVVMTDWMISIMNSGGKYPAPQPAKMAAAGGDIFMPGSSADYKNMLEGLKNHVVSRRQLEINATRLYKIGKKIH